MPITPIDSVYLGWAPEVSSIRIYWLRLLAVYSSRLWSKLKSKWLLPPPKHNGVLLPPPESLLLSHFLKDAPCWPPMLFPGLVATRPHCGIWSALAVPCTFFVCCFLLSPFSPFFSSLTLPYFPLSFLKSHLIYSCSQALVF